MLFVFMSQPEFACNPHALWKYICENTEHDTGWLLRRPERYEALRDRGIRCAVYNTLDGEKLLSEADYVVTNSYTYTELPKREGQIFVNLWHGSGVKTHDFYNHDMSPRRVNMLNSFFKKIDLMCVHSLDDRFRLSAMLNYDLRKSYVTGQPRLDCVKTSDGKSKLVQVFGDTVSRFERFVFYAPSFRANAGSHSGKIYSDNIFRLDDYEDAVLGDFLEKYNAVLIYKLHPIEQTAFSGREFTMNGRCLELTDDMLFHADVRYDELLNAFDVMMSDYSSIAFDFLLLDRPVVYLIPDYEEYMSERGFVFRNISDYMPGEKVHDFKHAVRVLEEAFLNPGKYTKERNFVITQRFDYTDGNSAKRCYEQITGYVPLVDEYTPYKSPARTKMPSAAEQLKPFLSENVLVVDSTRIYSDKEKREIISNRAKPVTYITQEIPNAYRRLSGQSSAEIADLAFYYKLKELPGVKIAFTGGGVDYKKFSSGKESAESGLVLAGQAAVKEGRLRTGKTVIGFAGTIDNRIYFAMVQCLCEVFQDCDIVFAGDIFGDYPVWLDGFGNLRYQEAAYDELPGIIQSFDVAVLPVFRDHAHMVPTELFQYLACGKQVVASNMPNLPQCEAVYISKSVAEAVENVKMALGRCGNPSISRVAQETAKKYDWRKIAKTII